MKRDFLFVGCEGGHDWQSIGGRNASCHKECSCSVPVCVCIRCGEHDYGDSVEAVQTRADCELKHGPVTERFNVMV